MSKNNSFKFWYLYLSIKLKYLAIQFNLLLRKISYIKAFNDFLVRTYHKIFLRKFVKKWLRKNEEGVIMFDFNGAKLPDVSSDLDTLRLLSIIFEDTFLIPCHYNNNHNKSLVEKLDKNMMEGPYGITDGVFDVTVKEGDIVIDVGAWIGDFSAYATSKGAVAYAFEPVHDTFQILKETVKLNNNKIYPIQKGLGDKECELLIYKDLYNSGTNTIIPKENRTKETIAITTLDKFVKENNINRIDFIKADIEGAERDMLKGAAWVLKNFAPKLAICTYHLPDDPQVLEKLILEANPNYTVKHLRHKLFAMVVK
ncbi:MAG: FkbM family methyltransferase [Campylobacteraceae bacterium]|jgi:FkbM family methyltransferase|nr:FkbM family methyltransferase [Campylobacteraceae bacterium]